jgi:hypothetical protein
LLGKNFGHGPLAPLAAAAAAAAAVHSSSSVCGVY